MVETCNGQPGDPERLDEFLHPPGGHAEQVAGGDHGGQGAFGAAAALEQPIREIRPGAQLRDRSICPDIPDMARYHCSEACAGRRLP
jgi:hypothetical protein